jgi:cystathionine gamma-lyase
MKFGTKVIRAGVEPDPTTGAIMTPIYQTSTYVQESPGKHKGYEYSRTQNPTRDALQENLASLENGSKAFCFSSGLAGTDAILKTLSPGDEVISTNDLYGGTYRIFTKVFKPFGLSFRFIDMSQPSLVEEVISEKTKLIWIETPTNPLLNIIDIKAICEIAKKKGVKVCVDNTFATPYLQRPLDLGADLVLHSVTKYLGGHSDVVMGAVITSDEGLAEKIAFIQNASGAVPGPQDCFLVLRGVKTLHLRMDRHCKNAEAIANHLLNHSKVAKVFYPGLKNHPNHQIAFEQMDNYGGMVSFELKGGGAPEAIKFLENTQYFNLAESLGGVESLAGHPATMTHASIPKEEREKAGLSDGLIRLSVGVEDVEDLIEDLDQALAKI